MDEVPDMRADSFFSRSMEEFMRETKPPERCSPISEVEEFQARYNGYSEGPISLSATAPARSLVSNSGVPPRNQGIGTPYSGGFGDGGGTSFKAPPPPPMPAFKPLPGLDMLSASVGSRDNTGSFVQRAPTCQTFAQPFAAVPPAMQQYGMGPGQLAPKSAAPPPMALAGGCGNVRWGDSFTAKVGVLATPKSVEVPHFNPQPFQQPQFAQPVWMPPVSLQAPQRYADAPPVFMPSSLAPPAAVAPSFRVGAPLSQISAPSYGPPPPAQGPQFNAWQGDKVWRARPFQPGPAASMFVGNPLPPLQNSGSMNLRVMGGQLAPSRPPFGMRPSTTFAEASYVPKQQRPMPQPQWMLALNSAQAFPSTEYKTLSHYSLSPQGYHMMV